MRLKNLLILVTLFTALSALTFGARAEDVNKGLKVGDLVEAGVDWEPGVIVEAYKETEFGYGTYGVRFGGESGYVMRLNARFVRPRSAKTTGQKTPHTGKASPKTPPKPAAQKPASQKPAQPASGGAFRVGESVMFTSVGLLWETGAKIVSYDPQKRQYKVRTKHDGYDIVPCYMVARNGAKFDNSFFIGKWEVHINGATSTFTRDGDLYRRFSGGMKLPPLEIKADKTYVWQIAPKKVIRGKWQDRKGARGIVLLKGIDGKNWTLYEKTEGYATNARTRDEIGFHDFSSNSGYYTAMRAGANKSCVLRGRKF